MADKDIDIIINLDPSPARKNLGKLADDAVKEFDRIKKSAEDLRKKAMNAIAPKGGEEGRLSPAARKALQDALKKTRNAAEESFEAGKPFGQKQRRIIESGVKPDNFFRLNKDSRGLDEAEIFAGIQEEKFREQIRFSLRDPDAVVRQMNAVPIVEDLTNAFFGLAEAEREAEKWLVENSEAVKAADEGFEGLAEAEREAGKWLEGFNFKQQEASKGALTLSDDTITLGDIITGIGPTAQKSLSILGNSLVQSTQTGERSIADLFATSQNLFRTFLTDTQRSATGAFQNFARSARGAVSDSLFALLRGDMKRFGDIWKNFANSLLDSLVNTGVKLAQSSLFRFLGIDGGTKRLALVA